MKFPKHEWEESAPEAQGLDSAKLNAALDYIGANAPGGTGNSRMLVVRNGVVVWRGADVDHYQQVWSCTKSISSACLGLLIADGRCTLDTLAADIVPEMRHYYPQVTLRHFAAMTSGYNAVGYTYERIPGTEIGDGSRTPFEPAEPLFAPGEKYAYWDDAQNQFGNVLTQIAGEPLKNLFARRIAGPIGMRNWDWKVQGRYANLDVNNAAGNQANGVYTTARELARFGLLFLNNGNWAGAQLIPAEWVAESTRTHVPVDLPHSGLRTIVDGRGNYGLNWWTNGVRADGRRFWPDAPPQTYCARGLHHNLVFVIPEWRTVIARTSTSGGFAETDVFNVGLRMIGEAFRSPA